MADVLSPTDALSMLDNLEKAVKEGKEPVDKLVQACNLVARAAPVWAVQSLKRDKKLFDKIDKIEKVMFPSGLPSEAPKEVTLDPLGNPIVQEPTDNTPVVNDAGERIGMDGKPLSPEEAAREAMMDAAIAGGEAEKNAAPTSPAGPQPGRKQWPTQVAPDTQVPTTAK
jgi:hypothetical protein